MANFKATSGQWEQLERSLVFNGSFQACVLELRSRVEALEADSQSIPNDRQIRSSLVERVGKAISLDAWDNEPLNWTAEAEAAIREVAAWLRENAGGTRAAWMLEQEAERG